MRKSNITEFSDTRTSLQDDSRVNRLVDELTLFDDDLMSLVFDKNIPATELVLKVILGRNIKVVSVDGQTELKSPFVGGRDITLDIHAIDVDGEEIDIEVQCNSEGAHVKRARFHSAMMDSRMLQEGDKFKSLRDSYVIFIYKHDKFSKGYPVYRAERIVLETGEPLNDGSHIIYVNGTYKGNDDLGKLIQDFHAKSSKDMNYKELADSFHHFKEIKKGRGAMSEAVRRYAEEYAAERAEISRINTLTKNVNVLMKNAHFTLEQAFTNLEISDSDRAVITEQLQK